MSFYGSLYYQAGEAFAKIFLDNFGAKNKDTTFKNVTEDSEILARSRKGDLTLRGGNRWITLEGETGNNVCTIRHNGPDTSEENLKTYIMPIQKATAPAEGIPVNELPLTDDIYITAPAVYYDEAGHIIPTGNITYFKIPKIAIQASIDDLEAQVAGLNGAVASFGQDLEKVTDQSDTNKTRVDSLQDLVGYAGSLGPIGKPITQIIGNVDSMRNTINETGQNSIGLEASMSEYLAQAYMLIDKTNTNMSEVSYSSNLNRNGIAKLQDALDKLVARVEALEKS